MPGHVDCGSQLHDRGYAVPRGISLGEDADEFDGQSVRGHEQSGYLESSSRH